MKRKDRYSVPEFNRRERERDCCAVTETMFCIPNMNRVKKRADIAGQPSRKENVARCVAFTRWRQQRREKSCDIKVVSAKVWEYFVEVNGSDWISGEGGADSSSPPPLSPHLPSPLLPSKSPLPAKYPLTLFFLFYVPFPLPSLKKKKKQLGMLASIAHKYSTVFVTRWKISTRSGH